DAAAQALFQGARLLFPRAARDSHRVLFGRAQRPLSQGNKLTPGNHKARERSFRLRHDAFARDCRRPARPPRSSPGSARLRCGQSSARNPTRRRARLGYARKSFLGWVERLKVDALFRRAIARDPTFHPPRRVVLGLAALDPTYAFPHTARATST